MLVLRKKTRVLFAFVLLLSCLGSGCAGVEEALKQTPDTGGDENLSPAVALPKAETLPDTAPERFAYGVFIGVNPEDAEALYDYETVVIDAAYYSTEEIQTLKRRGLTIYSYLNIGSIETFRDSFSEYEEGALGEYENWPGEYWMNVSLPAWQQYIQEEAETLVSIGVDGFFLDNADVYYEYPAPEIFQGLIAIIRNLGNLQKDILINGGDTFVTEAVLEPDTPLVSVTGVNQECVFTRIDFENKKLLTQTSGDTSYFQNYLRQCDDAGLMVYLTEYVDKGNVTLSKEIEGYCEKHGFRLYLSSSIELDGR